MDNKKHTNKVFGMGQCLDCGRIYVFDAKRFTAVDSSLCRDCFEKINDLRAVDGLPPIAGAPSDGDDKVYN